MIPKKHFNAVLERYLNGTATAEEVAWLESVYLNWNKENRREYSQTELENIKDNTWQSLRTATNVQATRIVTIKPTIRWIRIAMVAAMAMIIVSGTIWLSKRKGVNPQTEVASLDSIAPGSQNATLTLASGKKIRLSDVTNGRLVDEAGVRITKSTDGQLIYELTGKDARQNEINTLATTTGQTYQLILPDGTRIWLNAASAIKFPSSFVGAKQRNVEVAGEVYFEVAKDSAHPFVVRSRDQTVEVLGTHFNINAYPDEDGVKTTLIEGSVRVLPITSSTQAITYTLKPGQQSLLKKERLQIRNVSASDIIDWKANEFVLNDVDFKTAMRKIERWYDVEVVYEPDAPTNPQIGGWISRSNSISSVLELIASTGKVNFKIKGRRVFVTK